MKVIKCYVRFLILLLIISISASCGDDWLNINTDPNNPTNATSATLLTNAQLNITNSTGLSTGGLTSHLGVFMHQVVRRGAPDQYGTKGSDFMIITAWDAFYANALEDLRVIIDQSTANGDLVYVGVAKLLKAYAFSVMVDVWGDIPFTDANLMPEVRFPGYDDDREIYPELLVLIDEALSDIENEEASNINVPASDDLIYGGDTELWIKFANTLKLKLYNQVRMAPNAGDYNVDQNVNALLQGGNLISDMEEDFEIWYGTNVTPDNRHPGFIADYTGGSKTYYISPYFYQVMTGQNPDVLSNVEDPRLPYYFFNQLTDGATAQNPVEYRDGDFLSIHFGSTHPNQAQSQDQSQTLLGLYPCGGRYDDGEGGTVNQASAAGDVSERMLTYYTRLFIEAELALADITDGDPRVLLASGIEAAMAKVNQAAKSTAGSSASPQDIPALTEGQIDNYINDVLEEYDAAGNDSRRLEVIMTQKWIASFGNSVDIYNDYRRTGYPVLFDPNSDTGPFAPFTQSARDFLVSLPYKELELTINPEAPEQKNPVTDRVFWQPAP